MTKQPSVQILGTGHALPEKKLTNAELERMVATSNDWILERTGIHTRHVAEPGTPVSRFATEAARKALDQAQVAPGDIDLIIVGTVTGDMKFPATACIVQEQLGAHKAVAFDLSAACSGFLYGLQVAAALVQANGYQRVLVIGAEVLTSMVNWNDRNTCVLFGDGAGAAVLGPSNGGSGLLHSCLGSDGRQVNLLYNQGGSLHPTNLEPQNPEFATIHMEGREVFRHAVVAMSKVLQQTLDEADIDSQEIDLLIPHQANLRIIEALGKRFGIAKDKVYVNVERLGNTSAASIPIALDEALRSDRVGPGDLIAMVTFGAGLTWAAALYRC